MLNYSIASRSSENPFYCISFSFLCFYQRFISLLKEYTFFKLQTFLKKNFLSGPNFFQNLDSYVLPNSGLWVRVAGHHPAQILRPQHMIALKMPPADARLMFSTTNHFFRIWQCPGHVPAWEITTSATRCRLKCAPCPWKTTILTNLIFTEIQKTFLAIVRAPFLVPQYYFF